MNIKPRKTEIKKIDSFIGVYIFKSKNRPIYVGKSISVRARLLSHLENAKINAKEAKLLNETDKIETLQTDSEFKALILESELIKIHHPKYNVRWKDDKSYLYIKITIKEKYPKVLLSRKENDGKSLYFGPFSSTRNVYELLRETRKIFPFCIQKKISKSPCFYTKIGLCDPCPNGIEQLNDGKEKELYRKKYKKQIKQIVQLLKGNIESVQKNFYKRLKVFTKQEEYEQAIQMRNLILRLESLAKRQKFDPSDTSSYNQGKDNLQELIKLLALYYPKLDSIHRIECYDISNLGQKKATASMVVFTKGEPDKSQYRKFRIKNMKSNSDFQMIEEVLERRFKNKWDIPDLLIVDGGKPQIRVMLRVLAEIEKTIPVIGIAKNPDRLIVGNENLPTIRPKIHNKGFNLVQHMRDEAHRFARKYHLQLRERGAFF
ncbi:hypothetical protein A3G67_04055 [Candidatus Roizmanbacteria bacterium RIFCSPLOWO2_12_FULL_40_12]|uniref:Excinuclease ABC subunit C n=1 Tax=Candidatus Roizmanbacteria bacterium RIFCSPLOWO2_01_FULL_40_42 TaxID=1802066 RepID=A0A1F7J2D3_9BACT|nr:MAG: hypothetical protein A2779_01925 [Candidatus Roizmanbacteria bacterium RIFCSPHIGHO2_01_FULL_40_98]OGK27759.1 MAG: hypothetical protein A3C31_01435 [Candidatus Roizmanbacteria bacterium RIFCSPHIGHO2_02_FULL_40_53]OGK30684.1 MAG: hypothetical protein A2W49_01620 [Candidatus Roizmanbacteria bacterium RIFCSPHIGHO2_12_41_18]OGK36506.1 MAG: hypothetical protein A3E69_04830 [Candidatus Roizmanbacteria bacterium RIFCSPHIGHO2_12_FULL_40_130]OGK49768.1 MAG: hypothetical protein A3B50_04005 [Candi